MRKFKFIIDGHKYEVSVNEKENNLAEVEVNGTPFTVEIEKEVKIARPATAAVRTAAPTAAPVAPKTTGVSEFIKSPLPGSIVKVLVADGQAVKRGDVILTMESMKMENNIAAEKDGVVKSVLVTPGQNVMQDDKLVEFTAADVAAPVVDAPKVETPKPAVAPEAPKAPKAAAPAGGFKVVSPLPGSVVKVAVEVGQEVKKGDLLLTLESMKMENSILAERDGKVTSVAVSAGQSVMQDDVLVVLG